MTKWWRLGLLAGLLIFEASCASSGGSSSNDYRYTIRSHAWKTATVAFYCRGQIQRVVRTIHASSTHSGAVTLGYCEEPSFSVTFLASNERYDSGLVLGWTPRSTLDITIANYAQFTSWLLL